MATFEEEEISSIRSTTLQNMDDIYILE